MYEKQTRALKVICSKGLRVAVPVGQATAERCFFALPYLSLDFFVVLAATFFGPACLDFPEPWPDPPFPAFGLG
jgi:hypothetical protein